MIMGEVDDIVVPGATLQFADALIEANRDFELLYLPDKNHYESSNPYSTRRMWDFFVRHLLGQEPPAPVATPKDGAEDSQQSKLTRTGQ